MHIIVVVVIWFLSAGKAPEVDILQASQDVTPADCAVKAADIRKIALQGEDVRGVSVTCSTPSEKS